MPSLDATFCEHGQKRDVAALQQLVENLNTEELENLVKSKLNTVNFSNLWNYILQSFKDTSECQQKRFRVALTLLKELEEREMQSSRSSSLINRLCMELAKFTSEHLAQLCQFCLEWIQSKKLSQMSWKDLLPELLNVLSERETFEHNELEYTGKEYKEEFINTLCMLPWSAYIITSLTAAFIDTSLTKEQHMKVTNKLGSYIEKLTAQEIPSFVYQLLRLCKHQNGRLIFFRLQSYFGLRIYSHAKKDANSDNTPDLDTIETSNAQEIIEAESTVLYHIHTSASLGHNCVKDYLTSLKAMIKSPEYILQPFHLMSLFTISTISHYEETVFDVVRPAIVRFYNDEQRMQNSCWFREMVISNNKPEEILGQVIQYSVEDRDLVLQALVNFAFTLLSIGSALGRDSIAEKQWNLGNILLLKIIKRKRNVGPVIIQSLCNNIVTRQNASQYIECMYILSKTLPLLMLENQSSIVELMDSLIQIPGSVANQLLDALIPLTKLSPTIRDHLILLLKKALYSRVTDTRCMAVNGFLKLLTNLKIANLSSLSQSSGSCGSFTSGHSLFTQISLNRTTQSVGSSTFSNEALCLEVLGILRRCFMQQATVRVRLYEGLYDAVCMNPELGVPVLDVVYTHFKDYYQSEEDVLPPLDFKKIAPLREIDCILQEPLGKLIYCISLILNKVLHHEDDNENPTTIKFSTILDSLCKRMSSCELVHFELDDGTDFADNLPESQQKVHIFKEVMNVYEALIGYKICTWSNDLENAKVIVSLYQGYSRLLHFSKTSSKPKKGKKTLNKTTQSQQHSQNNTTLAKKSDGAKGQKNLKTPETILDFQVVEKALELLHMPKVNWTSTTEANIIKTNHDIHRHFMQSSISLVNSVKHKKDVEKVYRKQSFDHITNIASILYNRIVKRLNDFVDFDCATAILAMECFHNILVLVSKQFESNIELFLSKVGNTEKDESIVKMLTPFIEQFQKLFETEEAEISNDPEIKKLQLIVTNTLAVLVNHMPSSGNVLSVQMCDWVRKIAQENCLTNKVSIVYTNLMFDIYIKYKSSLTLLELILLSIGKTVGVISEEELNPEEMKIVNEATVHNILLCLCGCIKSILDDVDAVISRMKSEYAMINFSGEDIEKKKESLKTKEKGVTCHLIFIVDILTNTSNLAISPGNISEAIFKNIMLLYSTLSTLTKYFMARSSKENIAFQGARFERLVKLSGKQLAPVVYKFILHIEESQKQHESQTQVKKKVDSTKEKTRVLRETRLIPKVVYEIEQFSRAIIQLSNKTKLDLAKYVGQGTVRDFRIMHIKETLAEAGEFPVATQDSELNTSNNSVTNADEDDAVATATDNNSNEEEISSSPPLSKKRRI